MSFNLIQGQDKAINLLRQDIKENRLACVYLFTGPEATGKKLTALNFAKALTCQEDNLDSCDSCVSCLKIDKNQHPDLHFTGNFAVTDNDDTIKIEDIRQLQRGINLKPYEARKKIFILDNAHNLTPEAANALLKILEEPPGESIIILITAKPLLLFKTIISRCRIIKFYPLVRWQLKEFLKNNYNLDHASAHFLAFFSEGRLGYALKLKEEEIFRARDRVVAEFSLARSYNDELSIQNKEDLRKSLNILAVWFRDAYLMKAGISASEIINFDRKEELTKIISRYSPADLEKILESISETLLYLEQNLNTKLIISNLKLSLKDGYHG